MFYPDTCVGLRYGLQLAIAKQLFLEEYSSLRLALAGSAPRTLPSVRRNP